MLESFEFLKPNIEETVFESKPGANDKVLHFAFISPYPDRVEKKNMSTGITYYDCCELKKIKQALRIGTHESLLKKRIDIVPLSLGTILEKRMEYLKRNIYNFLL